jgi:hypothetical protein
MTDVIFDGSDTQDSKPENQKNVTTSGEVLQRFKKFFNDLEYRTLVALRNYYTVNDEWPTWRELADYMDEKPENIQPRLSELRESQTVVTAGKRPCSESDHNTSVNTFKPVHEKLRSNRIK